MAGMRVPLKGKLNEPSGNIARLYMLLGKFNEIGLALELL